MTPELEKALREAVRLGEEYNWVPTSDAEILERNRLIAERIIETVIYKHADELLPLVGGRKGIVCPFCSEDDFDLPGLRLHLERWCESYIATPLPAPPQEDDDER